MYRTIIRCKTKNIFKQTDQVNFKKLLENSFFHKKKKLTNTKKHYNIYTESINIKIYSILRKYSFYFKSIDFLFQLQT